MTFKTTAIVTAIVAFLLGAGYILAGALVIGRWQIDITGGVLLIGRRLGALYLGLSVIFFLARSTPVSAARTALSAGAAVTLSTLAVLGTYELAAGHVANGMLASIAIETLLAIAYLRILFIDNKQTNGGRSKEKP
jgi:hypothetical protein